MYVSTIKLDNYEEWDMIYLPSVNMIYNVIIIHN